MTADEPNDTAFDAFTSRMIRREALRRAAEELSTTTPAGLESALARISEEVTADAAAAKAATQPNESFDLSRARTPPPL
jgi:hypothetical protein